MRYFSIALITIALLVCGIVTEDGQWEFLAGLWIGLSGFHFFAGLGDK